MTSSIASADSHRTLAIFLIKSDLDIRVQGSECESIDEGVVGVVVGTQENASEEGI
jgi:hypothetical protein